MSATNLIVAMSAYSVGVNVPCTLSYLWNTIHNLFIYYLLNKALQHKCWRSVGHQVLQPAKDISSGQYVWKVADRRKKSLMHQDSLEPAAIWLMLERLQESARWSEYA